MQAVCDTPVAAYYWVCALIKDMGRRLPVELQCSLYPRVNRVKDIREPAHQTNSSNKIGRNQSKRFVFWKRLQQYSYTDLCIITPSNVLFARRGKV